MRCCQDFSLTFSSRFSPRKIHWKESFGEREEFRMIGEEEEEVKDKSNKSTAQKCFSDWHDNDNIHTYTCTLTHTTYGLLRATSFFLLLIFVPSEQRFLLLWLHHHRHHLVRSAGAFQGSSDFSENCGMRHTSFSGFALPNPACQWQASPPCYFSWMLAAAFGWLSSQTWNYRQGS